MQTTIHYQETGPLISYRRNGKDGILLIADLNPQMETKWRMSRMDMLRMAWRSFVAAVR